MKSLMTFICACLFASATLAAEQIEIQVKNKQTENSVQTQAVDYYSYYFGRVWVNSSAYASYKLTNTGTVPLTFLRSTISGRDYSARHSCGGVLEAGAACHFEIRFSPFWEGTSYGRFILSFVENLDIVVDVHGEGYRR